MMTNTFSVTGFDLEESRECVWHRALPNSVGSF